MSTVDQILFRQLHAGENCILTSEYSKVANKPVTEFDRDLNQHYITSW
jgi:hypothetical protein